MVILKVIIVPYFCYCKIYESLYPMLQHVNLINHYDKSLTKFSIFDVVKTNMFNKE